MEFQRPMKSAQRGMTMHTPEPGQHRTKLRHRGYEIVRTREIDPGERNLHSHDHYAVELIWSGTMQYLVEDRGYRVTNGDILLIGAGERHRLVPEPEQSPCERVILRVDRSFLKQLRSHGYDPAACFRADDPDRKGCLRFDDEDSWRIGELLERCIRENESEEEGAELMAKTIMLQVLILINRLYSKNTRSRHRDRSESLVDGVLAYINDHYAEELTLDSLAGRFFISKYHLSREFGRIVGRSVHRYITQKRLAAAKQMLGVGRSSSMVCQHCGFGDYSNFYRAFKSEYGISPKEYVANLREDAAGNKSPARMPG